MRLQSSINCLLQTLTGILSVCWPVQLSSWQLCQTVNPQPTPRCLFIAVTKSSISMVVGAQMTDIPECLMAGLPSSAGLLTCYCVVSDPFTGEIYSLTSVLWRLLHASVFTSSLSNYEEEENICFCCVWNTCCQCVRGDTEGLFDFIERVSSLAMFIHIQKEKYCE